MIAHGNWQRDNWYDDTGLLWINPSPNMRNLNQAALYPGIGAIEYSNISVGRGTDQPFEHIGAPWIDGRRLAAALNARRLPGIRFYPVTFTPKSSKYANEECEGVFMVVTNRTALQPARVGIEIASALFALYRDKSRPGQHVAPRGSGIDRRAHQARGGSGCHRIERERGRSQMAPPARQVFVVPLSYIW